MILCASEKSAQYHGECMTDFVSLGLLFVGLVGVITLVVAVLALRSSQTAVWLAEQRNEYLGEERERLELLSEEHKSLHEELERERQQRSSLEEELDHERQQRLEAEQRAERAQQEALKGAAQQLRKQMDHYLVELEEKEGTDPGLGLAPSEQQKGKKRTRH
jgi:uncharacterized membrane protein YhiD involved in acid resistance